MSIQSGASAVAAKAIDSSYVNPKASLRESSYVEAVCHGNTAFAVDIYRRLAAIPGNVFFSPFSLSMALAMVYAGAKGETARQIGRVLRFGADHSDLYHAFSNLFRNLQAVSSHCRLFLANALWVQRGFGILAPFLAQIRTCYVGNLYPVDFQSDAEVARAIINHWVETQTRHTIRDHIGPGIMSPTTRLVLTSAVCFKGLWADAFRKDRTRNQPFHLSAGKTVMVPQMNITRAFGYFEDDRFQGLEMPYKDGSLCMVILLPRAADGLSDLECALTPERLMNCAGGMLEREVAVTIPRFRMTSEFRFERILGAMGMPLAFSGAADFSGMIGRPGLFVS